MGGPKVKRPARSGLGFETHRPTHIRRTDRDESGRWGNRAEIEEWSGAGVCGTPQRCTSRDENCSGLAWSTMSHPLRGVLESFVQDTRSSRRQGQPGGPTNALSQAGSAGQTRGWAETTPAKPGTGVHTQRRHPSSSISSNRCRSTALVPQRAGLDFRRAVAGVGSAPFRKLSCRCAWVFCSSPAPKAATTLRQVP